MIQPNAEGKYPNCPAGIKAAMNSVPEGAPYEEKVDWDDDGLQYESELLALAALAITAKEDPGVFTPEQRLKIESEVAKRVTQLSDQIQPHSNNAVSKSIERSKQATPGAPVATRNEIAEVFSASVEVRKEYL